MPKFSLTCFSAFITLVFPFVLVLALCVSFKINMKYALYGAIGFVVPQLLIRTPILSLPVVNFYLSLLPSLLTLFIMAVTAALFETSGRYIIFKLFFKKEKRLTSAIVAGAAHGSIESVLLAGVNLLVTAIFYGSLIFAPISDLLTGLPSGSSASLSSTYTNQPAYYFLLGAGERLGTIAFHTFASVFLYKYMCDNKTLKGFCLLTLMHTAIDMFLPLIATSFGEVISTVSILIIGTASILGIYKLIYIKSITLDAAINEA